MRAVCPRIYTHTLPAVGAQQTVTWRVPHLLFSKAMLTPHTSTTSTHNHTTIPTDVPEPDPLCEARLDDLLDEIEDLTCSLVSSPLMRAMVFVLDEALAASRARVDQN